MPYNILTSHTQRSARFSAIIIDSDKMLQSIYKSILPTLGFQDLLIASNTDEAVEKFSTMKRPYDLLISEWRFPEASGEELIGYVRREASEQIMFMPILVVTGATSLRHLEAMRDHGVNGVVSKPFDVNTLYKRVLYSMLHPRDFILCDRYIGPCRRHMNTSDITFPDRRRLQAA